ncbi:hypothetical protein, partial [Streptomyces monashensis]|uniref:hypothetical protein n=1 Tax=Streptomyces monashensis TaxID=1678012 RepID=UPI001C42ECD0
MEELEAARLARGDTARAVAALSQSVTRCWCWTTAAVELLFGRVRAHRAGWTPTAHDTDAAVAVCTALGGLPQASFDGRRVGDVYPTGPVEESSP